jgi:hypothetical protein
MPDDIIEVIGNQLWILPGSNHRKIKGILVWFTIRVAALTFDTPESPLIPLWERGKRLRSLLWKRGKMNHAGILSKYVSGN